jgi:hypothetical protein
MVCSIRFSFESPTALADRDNCDDKAERRSPHKQYKSKSPLIERVTKKELRTEYRNVFQVVQKEEKIIKHSIDADGMWLLVKWKDLPEHQNRWIYQAYVNKQILYEYLKTIS